MELISTFKLNSHFHELLDFYKLVITLRAKNLTLKKFTFCPESLLVGFLLFSEKGLLCIHTALINSFLQQKGSAFTAQC
jgi:hypothetical protein